MLNSFFQSRPNSSESLSRREFMTAVSGSITALGIFPILLSMDLTEGYAAADPGTLRDRIEAMLLGSLIGDAAGGPVEFRDPEEMISVLPATRNWADDKILDSEAIAELADSFPMLSYEKLRPDPAPYGQWTANAPAGTITDDSRMKIILFNTLWYARRKKSFPIMVI